MAKRVGIFTTNSVEKIHPRIEMQVEILKRKGYEVDVLRSTTKRESFIDELRNWFSLKFFKKGFITQNSRKIQAYDIVHVYDYQLLPLAKKAKKAGKKVVYETLDDMVHLHFYALQKKIVFLKLFKNIIIRRHAKYEREIAGLYCDAVIVNSRNLLENFDKATLIYYASPLEGIHVPPFDSNKKTAFLYLGKLTESKGATIYEALINKHGKEMLFLGKPYDTTARKLVEHQSVTSLGNLDALGLNQKLSELMTEYNLIGLSIIIPENKSYALQEANKDIDYLAMGMPFIGNSRVPTYEKIKDGAGVLYSEDNAVSQLCSNEREFYSNCGKKCIELYANYSQSKFEEKLVKIYNSL